MKKNHCWINQSMTHSMIDAPIYHKNITKFDTKWLFLKIGLPRVVSTLVITMLNPTWKLAFGIQNVTPDNHTLCISVLKFHQQLWSPFSKFLPCSSHSWIHVWEDFCTGHTWSKISVFSSPTCYMLSSFSFFSIELRYIS
jgi:hypothetical protein